jgi:hypothetical protein
MTFCDFFYAFICKDIYFQTIDLEPLIYCLPILFRFQDGNIKLCQQLPLVVLYVELERQIVTYRKQHAHFKIVDTWKATMTENNHSLKTILLYPVIFQWCFVICRAVYTSI